jgi:apolipoprotein N-acyltransferase
VTLRVAGASAAAGLLLALSVPPFGWWPLAFAGAGLLYWLLAGLGVWARLGAGWVAGLGCFVPGLFWARSFNWYGAAALMAVEALTLGLAAVLTPPRAGRLPAFVGANTLCEALRWSWPFGGLPIGGVFLGQAGGPFLVTARVGGPLLMTAVVWAGGGALGEIFRRDHHRVRAAAVGVAIVVLALVSVVAPDGGPPTRHLTVAAVQGGGRRGTSATEVDPRSVFVKQVRVTVAAAPHLRRAGVSLVVWPEDVVPLDVPLRGSTEAAGMSRLARRLRATLVAGVTTTASAPGTFRNEVVAWGPDGRIVGVFEKVHRVPFGEYVPFRGFFSHLASLSAVPLDAVPGHGSGLLRTPAGPLGVMVSYEVFFADRGRSAVRAGAQLLVVPTNTTSYATSQMPSQEVAADRVQAVSLGRDLVQAAPTGFSTVVDRTGRVVAHTGLGEPAVLVATVSMRRSLTWYARWGDWPVLVLALLALGEGWRWQRRHS